MKTRVHKLHSRYIKENEPTVYEVFSASPGYLTFKRELAKLKKRLQDQEDS